jgi:hypothetical protein
MEVHEELARTVAAGHALLFAGTGWVNAVTAGPGSRLRERKPD